MKERLLEVGDAEDRARLDADGDGMTAQSIANLISAQLS
jgi:hypothetical protein